MSTDQQKKREPYDGMKAMVIKATAQHFDVTESYVRMCVGGSKINGRSKEIKIFFEEKYTQLQNILR